MQQWNSITSHLIMTLLDFLSLTIILTFSILSPRFLNMVYKAIYLPILRTLYNCSSSWSFTICSSQLSSFRSRVICHYDHPMEDSPTLSRYRTQCTFLFPITYQALYYSWILNPQIWFNLSHSPCVPGTNTNKGKKSNLIDLAIFTPS